MRRSVGVWKWQGRGVGVHQRDLVPDEGSQHLLRMMQVGTLEINDQHRNIWPDGRDAPPVPAPTPADVENHCSTRHSFQKAIDLAVHHRNGVASGDRA